MTVLVLHANGVEEELLDDPCELEEEQGAVEALVAEVSINSVVGLTSPRTIKLKGKIGETEVIVLIDSGATHNFLSKRVIQQLGLTASSTEKFGVLVAGGVKVQGQGIIGELELKFPSCTVKSSFLPLDLGIADVILGIQ